MYIRPRFLDAPVVLSPAILWYSRKVPHRGHHELGKGPWSPQRGRGEMAMAWPGCMLHQTFSLSSVPV